MLRILGFVSLANYFSLQEHPYLFTYENSNYMPKLAMNYPIFKVQKCFLLLIMNT